MWVSLEPEARMILRLPLLAKHHDMICRGVLKDHRFKKVARLMCSLGSSFVDVDFVSVLTPHAYVFEEYQQIHSRPELATTIKPFQRSPLARDNAPEISNVSTIVCHNSVPSKAYIQYSAATVCCSIVLP